MVAQYKEKNNKNTGPVQRLLDGRKLCTPLQDCWHLPCHDCHHYFKWQPNEHVLWLLIIILKWWWNSNTPIKNLHVSLSCSFKHMKCTLTFDCCLSGQKIDRFGSMKYPVVRDSAEEAWALGCVMEKGNVVWKNERLNSPEKNVLGEWGTTFPSVPYLSTAMKSSVDHKQLLFVLLVASVQLYRLLAPRQRSNRLVSVPPLGLSSL